MQEPQLVPAFSCAPISAADLAPDAIASQIVVRPTPKQAQTTGPVLARPVPARPDSSMPRSSSPSRSATKRPLMASQSPASRAGPTNRQASMRSAAKLAARKTPPPKSRYSATSSPATDLNQIGQ